MDPQGFHFLSTAFPHARVGCRYRRALTVPHRPTTLTVIVKVLLALLVAASVADAQSENSPLYRVFLVDGSALASYGEWAHVEDRLVFSMPLTPGSDPDQLHLVSIAADRVDWPKTEQYADAVRATHYAARRGEEDFAQFSSDVARALNEVALKADPGERLAAAESARRALADWPGAHYGYRAREVHDMLGILDEVIGGLRASAGLPKYEFALMATTTPPPPAEILRPAPDHTEVVQQLLTAATLVDTPAEKISLLQTVLGILDRAASFLPESWAARVRATALGSIAEEQKIETAYSRLRADTLANAARYAEAADVRALERLRTRVREQDTRLGQRRPAETGALVSAIEANLESAHRLRLARDQWLLRVDRLREYQKASAASVGTLSRARQSLDDIRSLAGPAPQRLKPLAEQLAFEGRRLSRVEPPAELTAVHAAFRSACELALNAVRIRLDAAEAADLGLAQRASSAAAGALMLLAKAKADLDAALRPPTVRADQKAAGGSAQP